MKRLTKTLSIAATICINVSCSRANNSQRSTEYSTTIAPQSSSNSQTSNDSTDPLSNGGPLKLTADQLTILKTVLPDGFKISLYRVLKDYMYWHALSARDPSPEALVKSFSWVATSLAVLDEKGSPCIIPSKLLEETAATQTPAYVVCSKPITSLPADCHASPFDRSSDAVVLVGCATKGVEAFPQVKTTGSNLTSGATFSPGCGTWNGHYRPEDRWVTNFYCSPPGPEFLLCTANGAFVSPNADWLSPGLPAYGSPVNTVGWSPPAPCDPPQAIGTASECAQTEFACIVRPENPNPNADAIRIFGINGPIPGYLPANNDHGFTRNPLVGLLDVISAIQPQAQAPGHQWLGHVQSVLNAIPNATPSPSANGNAGISANNAAPPNTACPTQAYRLGATPAQPMHRTFAETRNDITGVCELSTADKSTIEGLLAQGYVKIEAQ